jgi:hypothetical protein
MKVIMMHQDHDIFIQAVTNRKKVILTYYSGIKKFYLTVICVPLRYSLPDSNGGPENYYFWDEVADIGKRLLELSPSQMVLMQISDETYNPSDFICSEASS